MYIEKATREVSNGENAGKSTMSDLKKMWIKVV